MFGLTPGIFNHSLHAAIAVMLPSKPRKVEQLSPGLLPESELVGIGTHQDSTAEMAFTDAVRRACSPVGPKETPADQWDEVVGDY